MTAVAVVAAVGIAAEQAEVEKDLLIDEEDSQKKESSAIQISEDSGIKFGESKEKDCEFKILMNFVVELVM